MHTDITNKTIRAKLENKNGLLQLQKQRRNSIPEKKAETDTLVVQIGFRLSNKNLGTWS